MFSAHCSFIDYAKLAKGLKTGLTVSIGSTETLNASLNTFYYRNSWTFWKKYVFSFLLKVGAFTYDHDHKALQAVPLILHLMVRLFFVLAGDGNVMIFCY